MNNDILPELKNVILDDNNIYVIDEEVLKLSKDLVKLTIINNN